MAGSYPRGKTSRGFSRAFQFTRGSCAGCGRPTPAVTRGSGRTSPTTNLPHQGGDRGINLRWGRADADLMLTDLRTAKPPVYRLQLLEEPRVSRAGIEHGPEQGRELLHWRDVLGAVAAEVGEPEGVRTIVFDLLAQAGRGARVALRLDAEPGDAAA